MLVSCHLGRLGHFTERLPANKKPCPPMVQIIRFIVSGASPMRYSGFFLGGSKGGVNLGGWKGLGASKTTVRL